mmetsp:Transcript_35468/g.101270  ORF Transcript_35468/g.101270 Transcript_35468/m.101270 type:complete len:471 (+) Transcript_35468:844-2256(+)
MDTRHLGAPHAGVDERIVGCRRKRDFGHQHLLAHRPDAVKLLLVAESLDDRAVDDGIHQRLHLRISLDLADQLKAALDVAILDQSLDHAPNSDTRGDDAQTAHLLPRVPGALRVLHEAVGADDAAEGVGAPDGNGRAAALLQQLPPQQVRAARPHEGLANRAEEHLVHARLQIADVFHDLVNVACLGAMVDILQKDRAGDSVGLQIAGLHVVDDPPHVLAAILDGRIEKLVERDAVRGRSTALALHLLNGAERFLEVAMLELILYDRVVGHNIGHAGGLRLCRDPPSGHGVLAKVARREESIVQASCLLRTGLEDLHRICEVFPLPEPLEQGHLPSGLGYRRQQAPEHVKALLAQGCLRDNLAGAGVARNVHTRAPLFVQVQDGLASISLRPGAFGGEAHQGSRQLGAEFRGEVPQRGLSKSGVAVHDGRLCRSRHELRASKIPLGSLSKAGQGILGSTVAADHGGVRPL